jgi:phosphosulfolactate synthase
VGGPKGGKRFMYDGFLHVPKTEAKPRNRGITVLIDAGLPLLQFNDAVQSFSNMIDFVKFGWCTALVEAVLDKKLETLRANHVDFFFGGTLFEKALYQKRLDRLYDYLKRHRCTHVEISNGTLDITNTEKANYIAEFAREFTVFSEVGYKESARSEAMYPKQWIAAINEDLAAGARKVITESRESGMSGICRPNGELRHGLIEEILEGVSADALIFEAPTKALQAFFVNRLGAGVNLGNIAFHDIVGLETLRLGLRSDTFYMGMEPERHDSSTSGVSSGHTLQ